MSCVDRREQVEVNVWRSATPDPSSAIWKTNREKPELLATGEALTKTEKLRSYLQKLEQLKVAKRRKKMSSGKINEFSLGVSRESGELMTHKLNYLLHANYLKTYRKWSVKIEITLTWFKP